MSNPAWSIPHWSPSSALPTTQPIQSLARARLIEALRCLDAAGGWGWPDGRSPFPGLYPFATDQHRVFFGRDDENKRLTELVRSMAGRGEGAGLFVTRSVRLR